MLHASWLGGAANAGNYTINFASDSRFKGVTLAAADFGGVKTVTYDVLGGPSGGGTIDLAANGVSFRISVAAITGRVTVAPLTQ